MMKNQENKATNDQNHNGMLFEKYVREAQEIQDSFKQELKKSRSNGIPVCKVKEGNNRCAIVVKRNDRRCYAINGHFLQ